MAVPFLLPVKQADTITLQIDSTKSTTSNSYFVGKKSLKIPFSKAGKIGVQIKMDVTTAGAKTYNTTRATNYALFQGAKMQMKGRKDNLPSPALDLLDNRLRNDQMQNTSQGLVIVSEAAGADSYRAFIEIDNNREDREGLVNPISRGVSFSKDGELDFSATILSLLNVYSALPATSYLANITITIWTYELKNADDFLRYTNWEYQSYDSTKSGAEVAFDIKPSWYSDDKGALMVLDPIIEDITWRPSGGVVGNAIGTIKMSGYDQFGREYPYADTDITEIADEAREKGYPLTNTLLGPQITHFLTLLGQEGYSMVGDDGKGFTKIQSKVYKNNADTFEILTKWSYIPVRKVD